MQSFKARIFVCGTDSPLNQLSSTVAFQLNMRDKKLEPTKVPPWHILILNTKESNDVYRSKELPSIVHVPEFKKTCGQTTETIREHFYERQSIQGEFTSDFHLHSFPFDSQLLKIEMSLDCPTYIAYFDKAWLAANRYYGNKEETVVKDSTIQLDVAFKQVLESSEWELNVDDIFYSLRNYEVILKTKHNKEDKTNYGKSFPATTVQGKVHRYAEYIRTKLLKNKRDTGYSRLTIGIYPFLYIYILSFVYLSIRYSLFMFVYHIHIYIYIHSRLYIIVIKTS